MTAVLREPLCRNILAKTARIHMRNAYQLQFIAKKTNHRLILTNTRNDRSADLTDVIELMLLGVRPNDQLELNLHLEDDFETQDSSQNIMNDIEQVLVTP
ncbi:HPr family phosphocarrier protein [Alteromonas sp. BZK5]|jgi:phosphotransferase system HPr-like phosphotransfer protein|uniref:HPr family phosphocarrier protein n=1 Tax=Alteromonas sp. BZK5 TaxID=1904459 RepID=UPI001CA3A8C0|nr:HPr family phosphocarrier protein [Alteromonas sp. BZK5]